MKLLTANLFDVIFVGSLDHWNIRPHKYSLTIGFPRAQHEADKIFWIVYRATGEPLKAARSSIHQVLPFILGDAISIGYNRTIEVEHAIPNQRFHKIIGFIGSSFSNEIIYRQS